MKKNHFLSDNLEKAWRNYEQSVHASRDKLSPKHIHKLRISTQRLEAVLTLAHSLKDVKHADHITELLKKIRKSLGPLRDSQVESPILKNVHATKKMIEFFKQDKHHAKKKAQKALENIQLKHERSIIDDVLKEILDIEFSKNKKEIQSQLDQKMKSSVFKFNLLLSKVDPEEMKDIHHFRIFAKKLRYQAECLQCLDRKLQFSLKKLKNKFITYITYYKINKIKLIIIITYWNHAVREVIFITK